MFQALSVTPSFEFFQLRLSPSSSSLVPVNCENDWAGPSANSSTCSSNNNNQNSSRSTWNAVCSLTASGSIMSSLPTTDIGKLSYYLKCCVLGCSMPCKDNADIYFDLFDYENAYTRLSLQQQDLIYELVRMNGGDYSFYDHVQNRYIFVDEHHQLLPQNMSNVFITIPNHNSNNTEMFDDRIITALRSIVSSSLAPSAASTSELILKPGRQVMLCTKKWVQEFYTEPLSNYIQDQQLRSILFQLQPQCTTSVRATGYNSTVSRNATSICPIVALQPSISVQDYVQRILYGHNRSPEDHFQFDCNRYHDGLTTDEVVAQEVCTQQWTQSSVSESQQQYDNDTGAAQELHRSRYNCIALEGTGCSEQRSQTRGTVDATCVDGVFGAIDHLGALSESIPQASVSSARNHHCIPSFSPKKRPYSNTHTSSYSEPTEDIIPIVKALPVAESRSDICVKRRRKSLSRKASMDRNAAACFIPGQSVRIVNMPKSRAFMNECLATVKERRTNGQVVVNVDNVEYVKDIQTSLRKQKPKSIQLSVNAKNLIIVMDSVRLMN